MENNILSKDTLYNFLQEPTLESLRIFLQQQTGEHNEVDFKREWIEKDKLAKIMLSLANYGGGIVIFGVTENEDNTFSCTGLTELKEKEKISSEVSHYISSNLKYEIYDFSYDSSEYEKLINKKFQIMIVYDTPENIPFISHKDGNNIKQGAIYIRRGTSNEQATEEELNEIIKRRLNYSYPSTGRPLSLEEHLKQLKTLYINISLPKYKNGIAQLLNLNLPFSETNYKNPLYHDETYEEFISNLILEKKEKIKRILDLR